MSESGLDRRHFAWRLAIFVVLSSAIAVMGKISLLALFSKGLAARWPFALTLVLCGIAGLWLLTIIALIAYLFLTKAVLPRLTNIGFYGPVRGWIAALTVLAPVNVLVLLAMLLVPPNYIPRR